MNIIATIVYPADPPNLMIFDVNALLAANTPATKAIADLVMEAYHNEYGSGSIDDLMEELYDDEVQKHVLDFPCTVDGCVDLFLD